MNNYREGVQAYPAGEFCGVGDETTGGGRGAPCVAGGTGRYYLPPTVRGVGSGWGEGL